MKLLGMLYTVILLSMAESKPYIPSLPSKPADLGEPEIEISIQYPDFSQKRPAEKLDAFTDIQAECWGDSLEIVLRKVGIDESEYKSIIDSPDYMRTLHRKCIDRRVGPRLAAIYEKLAANAESGDPVFVKMAMQTNPDNTPDHLTVVNQQLVNMTNSELEKELEHLQTELKELDNDK